MKAEVVQPQERLIQLTMTESEAGVLRWLCHYVISGPEGGPRVVIDAINDALCDVGVHAPFPKYRVDWDKSGQNTLYIENADTKGVE